MSRALRPIAGQSTSSAPSCQGSASAGRALPAAGQIPGLRWPAPLYFFLTAPNLKERFLDACRDSSHQPHVSDLQGKAISVVKMADVPARRLKREQYRTAHRADEASTELPRKKFYRQRAHANPFSDHNLI